MSSRYSRRPRPGAFLLAAGLAVAAASRAPQAGALADPSLRVTGFLAPPETRVGPQRLSVGVFQMLPAPGKRSLRAAAARSGAAAAAAEVEVARLDLVTESRCLYYELAHSARLREITHHMRSHLVQHEEIARARYSVGRGLGRVVILLQAEITRVETRLLEVERAEAGLRAAINRLLDRPASTHLPEPALPEPDVPELDAERLTARAFAGRPELAAVEARIAAARAGGELAALERRPDVEVGLSYTLVEPRDDLAVGLMPPEDDGADVVAIQGSVNLPVRRERLAAAAAEAAARESAARQERRRLEAGIRAAIGELTERLELGVDQLRRIDDLLLVQAEESLESALAGYIAGTNEALDLLDAEHLLFEAQAMRARAHADWAIDLARLEGAVGEPLAGVGGEEER